MNWCLTIKSSIKHEMYATDSQPEPSEVEAFISLGKIINTKSQKLLQLLLNLGGVKMEVGRAEDTKNVLKEGENREADEEGSRDSKGRKRDSSATKKLKKRVKKLKDALEETLDQKEALSNEITKLVKDKKKLAEEVSKKDKEYRETIEQERSTRLSALMRREEQVDCLKIRIRNLQEEVKRLVVENRRLVDNLRAFEEIYQSS